MPKNDLNVTLKGMFSDQIDDEDIGQRCRKRTPDF